MSDRRSDIFAYLATCVDLGKEFVVRAFHNRVLAWEADAPEATEASAHTVLDYARSLPPQPGADATVHVAAHSVKGRTQPARDAAVVRAWAPVMLPPPTQAPEPIRSHAPVPVWVLRVWEPHPPPDVEPVEWILLCSVPIQTVADADRTVDWYTCRWLCEDYHQCLKTGCGVERTQLDAGADIGNLLGFAAPIAVRLLQLRQAVRQSSEVPAVAVLDPLMVEVLARRQHLAAPTLSLAQFWQAVARLGGHQGRRSDSPPGWRTLWKGWRYLSDLTEGAHLVVQAASP